MPIWAFLILINGAIISHPDQEACEALRASIAEVSPVTQACVPMLLLDPSKQDKS